MIVPLPFCVPERVMEKGSELHRILYNTVARCIDGNNQPFKKNQSSSQVLEWQNLLEHNQTSILALRSLYEEQA